MCFMSTVLHVSIESSMYIRPVSLVQEVVSLRYRSIVVFIVRLIIAFFSSQL